MCIAPLTTLTIVALPGCTSAPRAIEARSLPSQAQQRAASLESLARSLLDALRDSGVGSVLADVEGSFVFTDRGWKAIALTRVKAPRTSHADLELAPCEVERGIR